MQNLASAQPSRSPLWLSIGALLSVLLAAWAFTWWHVRTDWLYTEEYRHGWAVPFLAVYLFSLRWPDRPGFISSWGLQKQGTWFILLFSLLFIPLIIIRESNPDWRFIGIALGLWACGLTLLIVRLWWGKSACRHFAFPICFMLLALPWPSVIENASTRWLMPTNARLASLLLGFLGLAVECRGNLIQLPVGLLDVEVACSGVRSLQATLLIALFFGELNRLRSAHRFYLLMVGWGVALLTNVLRTASLGLAAAHEGLGALDRWHDPAGYIVLALNFSLLWAATHFFKSEPTIEHSFNQRLSSPPWQWATAILLCMVSGVFAKELWYRRNEQKMLTNWEMRPLTASKDFHQIPLSDRTNFMLRATEGWSAKWRAPNEAWIQALYFRWASGATPPSHMDVHTPAGCLNNVGLKQQAELEPMLVELSGQRLNFRVFRYLDGEAPLFLFYLVQQDWENADEAVRFDFSYKKRLLAALKGNRNAGQRMVELGFWMDDEAQARSMALDEIKKMYRVVSHDGA